MRKLYLLCAVKGNVGKIVGSDKRRNLIIHVLYCTVAENELGFPKTKCE